jgi:hypothetical protein
MVRMTTVNAKGLPIAPQSLSAAVLARGRSACGRRANCACRIAAVSTSKVSPARRFVRPVAGATLESIAAQALPSAPAEEALTKLREWNPHLANRRGGMILVSDIVFIEA